MSRLTELIRQAKEKDPALGAELEREYRALASRRAFGLNFERHRPEAVELPSRPVRRGDKVRVLPPRGSADRADERLWRVTGIERSVDGRLAHLEPIGEDGREPTTASADDLVVVAEFRDAIHPGLVRTGGVHRGGDKPAHTVITGENFHVLKALTYTHRHSIDAIYIDPPYNTGARDWKYNNDYVEADDLYRHSKWLAFMERRLLLAKELLNPEDSVLIVTIDEKEVHRLGLLLEQTFPEARIQMVTIVINPSGTSRDDLSRVEEYAYFAFFGAAVPSRTADNLLTGEADKDVDVPSLAWESLLRRGNQWYRSERPNLCYPVLLDPESLQIVGAGEPFSGVDESTRPLEVDGYLAAWPVRTDGRLGIWRKDAGGLLALAQQGYAYVSSQDHNRGTWTIKYLMSGTVDAISAGEIEVVRSGPRGEVVPTAGEGRGSIAKTVWNRSSHNAGTQGSALLRSMIPGRRFPFPKSLYAVEDAVRISVKEKSNAVILDFFAGSGTTAHAVMRLNKQDGGRRQCISVTNNEVSADEQKRLREQGLRPGDPEWEALGICDHITKPRIEAAITGRTPEGEPIKGEYKFTDEFPMADGFDENAEFFTLTYENPTAVGHNRAFERIAPLLWLRAGAEGRCIDSVPDEGWEVADTYGVLWDLDESGPFLAMVEKSERVRLVYLVTDDDRRFESVAQQVAEGTEVVRLYESYLSNFRFAGVEP